MARRANGEGSFTKKDNGFEYRVCFDAPNGDIIRKSFSAKTQRECKEKAKKFKKQLEGNKIVLENITLKKWAEKWLETYKKNTVSQDTYKSYKADLNIILDDDISKLEISKIKPINVQEFFNRKTKYAISKQKKLRNYLRAIFNTAIENNLCLSNPAQKTKLTSKKPPIKKEAYTEQEIDVIKEFCITHPFGIAILIMLYSGLRRGELLALTWNNYNQDELVFNINSYLTKTDGIKNGSTKNKNHSREVPIPQFLGDILNAKEKNSLYIIGEKANSYMTIDEFRYRYDCFFKDLQEKYNIRKLPAHCLRHTYGTMLYRRGIDIKTIQTLMGHSSINITADTYTHTDIETSKKAVILAFNA